MSIVIQDPQPEQLARTLAAAEDTSIESVVRERLLLFVGNDFKQTDITIC